MELTWRLALGELAVSPCELCLALALEAPCGVVQDAEAIVGAQR